MYDKLIFNMGSEDSNSVSLPRQTIDDKHLSISKEYLRNDRPNLPQVAEIDVMRHFVNLSVKNHHILKGFYPLGSCTMKYNPVINEDICSLEGFTELHPYQEECDIQGILAVIHDVQSKLAAVSGFDAVSLMPAAGAHSEFAGMMIIREYHNMKGNDKKKNILIPDSAHGTNPASCILAGFNTVQIKSDSTGEIDLEDLASKIDEHTAGIMITNPNTLGIFECKIDKIADMIHAADGLVYMDGANFNAIMGIVKPGNIGADILHFNLHKTFSTPHGGGGPGGGGVAVNDKLVSFLPPYRVIEKEDIFTFEHPQNTMGALSMFYGNVNVIVRAWAYLNIMGYDGLSEATKRAVLNANYLRKALKDVFELEYDTPTLHEFVLSGSAVKKAYGVKTLDIAKRLLDYNMHAPTIYFPLIVHEALMIEPTETESRETLDKFIDVMKTIKKEAEEDPKMLTNAPKRTPVSRLNEIKALKDLNVNYYRSSNA